MSDEITDRYDDIIDLPHHVSSYRTPMSMMARAAQFAPFAALNGHGEAISETARLTSKRIQLSDDEMTHLSRRLAQAMKLSGTPQPPTCVFTYFQPDSRKKGGRYVQACGIIKKLDDYERAIILTDGAIIPLDSVIALRILRPTDD